MSAIRVECPKCGHIITSATYNKGKLQRCTKCTSNLQLTQKDTGEYILSFLSNMSSPETCKSYPLKYRYNQGNVGWRKHDRKHVM